MSAEKRRWTVERPGDLEDHDVGAERAVITPSGALAFYEYGHHEDKLIVGYAAGRWVEVWEQ